MLYPHTTATPPSRAIAAEYRRAPPHRQPWCRRLALGPLRTMTLGFEYPNH